MSKLLFIQPELTGSGGIQRVIPKVAQGLKQKGSKVSLLSFYGDLSGEKNFGTVESLNEKETRSFGHKVLKQFVRVKNILSFVRKYKPDVIIVSAHSTASLVLLLKTFRLIDVPVIHYVHQTFSDHFGNTSSVTIYLQRFADGFITVSQGLKDELASLKLSTNKVIEVAYNSVTVLDGNPIRPQVPHYISASRLESVRGVDALVLLAINHFSKYPGSLTIYGEGALRPELETVIQESGLAKRIILAGYTDDLNSILSFVTAYVSSARLEALGVALLESLASGVPIVCTDVPYGPREILKIGKDEKVNYPKETEVGILFADCPPEDSEKLALWVKENQDNFSNALNVVNKENLFMSNKLKARASDFSLSNQISQVEKVIEGVKNKYE